VETADTGQREDLRLSEPLRVLLREVIENGGAICGGLLDVLKDEP